MRGRGGNQSHPCSLNGLAEVLDRCQRTVASARRVREQANENEAPTKADRQCDGCTPTPTPQGCKIDREHGSLVPVRCCTLRRSTGSALCRGYIMGYMHRPLPRLHLLLLLRCLLPLFRLLGCILNNSGTRTPVV